MKDKKQQEQDRHLQAPSEANRDKHINFLAEERGEQDPADEGVDPASRGENTKPENVYAHDENRDRHLQAPTEANRDEHINFTALERGEKDPADEKTRTDDRSRQPERSDNPVYTNADAPQQQLDRDSEGVMRKGNKQDSSSIYSGDNATLQSKEEKQNDEKVAPEKNDHIEIPDVTDTEADSRIRSRGENSNKNL